MCGEDPLGHDSVCLCTRCGAGLGHDFDQYGDCRNPGCELEGEDPGCSDSNGHLYTGYVCIYCGFDGIADKCSESVTETKTHNFVSSGCVLCGCPAP